VSDVLEMVLHEPATVAGAVMDDPWPLMMKESARYCGGGPLLKGEKWRTPSDFDPRFGPHPPVLR
jgi:hypothetical protein